MPVLKWLTLSTLVAAIFAAAELHAESPAWHSETFATFHFSHVGARCLRPSDREFYHFNEYGRVSGKEWAELVSQFYMEELFRQAQGSATLPEETKARMKRTSGERAMAALALNRILDHEAAKLGLAPAITDLRLDYAVNSILVFSAVETDQVPTSSEHLTRNGRKLYDLDGNPLIRKIALDSDILSRVGREQLFSWLAARIAKLAESAGGRSRDVKFNLDWQYRDNGLGLSQELLYGSAEGVSFPETAVKFDVKKFPATFDEFREAIREQLKPIYLAAMRQATWMTLVRHKRADAFVLSPTLTTTEVRETHAALKDLVFTASDLRAEFTRIHIDAPEAHRGLQFAFKRDLLRAMREELDLSTAIASTLKKHEGEPVRVQVTAETRTQRALETAPNGEAIEERIARFVVSPSSEKASRAFLDDADGSLVVIVVTSQQKSAPTLIPVDDPRVRRVAYRLKSQRELGLVFRTVAERLYTENPVEFEAQEACASNRLPCPDPFAEDWALSLFPSRAVDGYEIEISTQALNTVFQTRNSAHNP